MAIENYETYTKNILEMIFNNQDNKGKGYAINGRAITRSI